MSEPSPPRVRCRPIGDGDLDGIVALLRRGVPGRPAAYWRAGFARQGARTLPEGAPRFGFMLESEGVPVGVILVLFSTVDGRVRANMSSWYVDPAFRMHASMLIFLALKRRDVTYINISPAPNTWSTIEAQGFRRYVSGQFLSLPLLQRGGRGARVHRVDPAEVPAAFASLPERELLLDHARMGWLSLVVEAPDGLHPFVFMPFSIRSGRVPLPIRQLVFCRDVADYVRFAGPLGRFLIRRGIALVLHDASVPEPGLLGLLRAGRAPKYARGENPPGRGDLAYTERVIFGP